MQKQEAPQRFIVKVSVKDIPGEPNARPFSLYEAFSAEVLQRPSRLEACADGFDAIHIPPEFDTQHAAQRWFIIDTGVREKIPREDMHNVPLKAFVGHLDDDKTL